MEKEEKFLFFGTTAVEEEVLLSVTSVKLIINPTPGAVSSPTTFPVQPHPRHIPNPENHSEKTTATRPSVPSCWSTTTSPLPNRFDWTRPSALDHRPGFKIPNPTHTNII